MVLFVGLVIGGQLSADRSSLHHHPRLGWGAAPLAEITERVAGAGVLVASQVEAIAAAETFLAPQPVTGSTLHVYAREAVGAVLTVDGAVHAPAGGPGTISHLPVGGRTACHCGTTGCLEASVSDAAIARTAHRAGIVAEPSTALVIAAAANGNPDAHKLLVERARLLGRGIALVRDVLNPDRVVPAGQAFTDYPPALPEVSAAFTVSSTLGQLPLHVSRFGAEIQALAACTAALRAVYANPLRAARKATARATAPQTLSHMAGRR